MLILSYPDLFSYPGELPFADVNIFDSGHFSNLIGE